MADKAWKAAEREVAEVLGGERVPVTGRQRGYAPDIEHNWLAIEVKRTGMFPKWLREAHKQAVASKVQAELKGSQEKLPVVIVKPHRTNARNSYILMQLGDFVDWFGNVPRESPTSAVEVFDSLDSGHKVKG